MKPLDPRLVRRSHAARGFLAAGGALALVQSAAIVGFAFALASAVTGVLDGRAPAELAPTLALLGGAVAVRAGASWLWEWSGAAGAQRVKRELRAELLRALDAARPGSQLGTAGETTLLGPGLDALDEYFGRYLPQLVLTVVATPVTVAAVWLADPLSGLVLVIVLPLVPVFMVLIGLATQSVQRRQWQSLQQLSRGFLEVVGGLSTLLLFGRAERQLGRIARVTDEYRTRTMKVLRITFLSGFTLELAASLSIALVAVSIGLRLVSGELALLPGLFVLVLAPDVFLPLRNVGAAFHASTAGMEASKEAFDVLDGVSGAVAPTGEDATTGGVRGGLRLRDLRVLREDRVVLGPVDLDVAPGEFVALVGPSGSGKSSLFDALLGFADWTGRAVVAGTIAAPAARERVAWAPQRPVLLAGTVASNVRLGSEAAPGALLGAAMTAAGVDVDAGLVLGADGAGLSGGQQQRVATARALHRLRAERLDVLLLDEPSSALDGELEHRLAAELRAIAASGVAVLVATHRPELAAAADRTVDVKAVTRV